MSSKYPPVHVVLTGACGTGMSAVAEQLSRLTGMPVADAADFHPATNRRKLATGQHLCAADLTPWRHRLRDWIADRSLSGSTAIILCPPLGRESRDVLREAEELSALTGQDATRLVFITLDSPNTTTTTLGDDEAGASVDATGHPEDVAELVLDAVARARTGGYAGALTTADRHAAQAREAAEQ